ncbi:electron transfer flavoprotein subunit alpha/FixB family protein [Thermovenabulum sp.]|uniref:electron transfer flavoprotein subunit alpha/FixB family protein n=1 Tax=Thermovenabulum sp. TaxID=3100335 RepID=UPI003C7C3322
MKKVMIYIDEEDFKGSVSLIGVPEKIYKNGKYKTYGVVINKEHTEISANFDYLINICDERIKLYDILNIINCIEELHKIYNFDCILIPATQMGRIIAPRLSMRFKVGLVADVIDVKFNHGRIEMIRPAFSGKIMANVVLKDCKPIMMSIRPNVFDFNSGKLKETKIINYKPYNIKPSQIELLEINKKNEVKDIRESEILVSGGGGVAKHFERLYLLADLLGGAVSASRKVVDEGIAPRSIQVGQTGKTVSPKLYIALGIRGAPQHMVGLKNAENIISVNINKEAPICEISDIVVHGNAIEFIDKLIEKIKSEKQKSKMIQ